MNKDIRVIAIYGLLQSGKTKLAQILAHKYNFNHFEIDKIIKNHIYNNRSFLNIIKIKGINILKDNSVSYNKIVKFIEKDRNKAILNNILKPFVIKYISENITSKTIIIDAWNAFDWWNINDIDYLYLVIGKNNIKASKYLNKYMIRNIYEYQQKIIKNKFKDKNKDIIILKHRY